MTTNTVSEFTVFCIFLLSLGIRSSSIKLASGCIIIVTSVHKFGDKADLAFYSPSAVKVPLKAVNIDSFFALNWTRDHPKITEVKNAVGNLNKQCQKVEIRILYMRLAPISYMIVRYFVSHAR
jgi:hypothetical protein